MYQAQIQAKPTARLFEGGRVVRFPIVDEDANFIADEDGNVIASDTHPLSSDPQ